MKFATGITTCPQRLNTLLPQTMQSVERAGFTIDRVMLDGPSNGPVPPCTTVYDPPIGPYANWIMTLHALFWSNRHADRFVIFEDDILCCAHLREYLESCPFPENGFLNLALHLSNAHRAKFHDTGWFPANRRCIGALGLVFDNAGARALLGQTDMIDEAVRPGTRFPLYVDAAVGATMNRLGYTQFCHKPSLVGHVGHESSQRNRTWPADLTASWPGEEFDAREWLNATLDHVAVS